MHILDPNGSIKAYRKELDFACTAKGILIGVGIFCGIAFLVCGGFVIASLFSK